MRKPLQIIMVKVLKLRLVLLKPGHAMQYPRLDRRYLFPIG